MNLTTDHANGVAIVRVGESRLMYPLLSEFASVVTQLHRRRRAQGARRPVDGRLRRQRHDRLPDGSLPAGVGAGGALKLAGVQKRVETMLTMTGAQNFIEMHPDEPAPSRASERSPCARSR